MERANRRSLPKFRFEGGIGDARQTESLQDAERCSDSCRCNGGVVRHVCRGNVVWLRRWRGFSSTPVEPSLRWLGTLGGDSSDAYGVSADGSVVVGQARNAAGQERAFRWTAAGGMQDLGTLGGDSSDAYGVSADGSVVVGQARNATGTFRAFRWTASRGMEDLNAAYASLLSGGSSLDAARAISPNGRYIVGFGFNAATGRTEAFLLDTGGEP
jgi:probable HAF family extracellular repeat protein